MNKNFLDRFKPQKKGNVFNNLFQGSPKAFSGQGQSLGGSQPGKVGKSYDFVEIPLTKDPFQLLKGNPDRAIESWSTRDPSGET